jgi:hypothetical protein
MAEQDFPAFRQFLESRPIVAGEPTAAEKGPYALTIRTVDETVRTWVYVTHDALGILVKKPGDSSPALSFIPWNTIVHIG